MVLRKLILVILICCAHASSDNKCSGKEVLEFIKQSTYDFSIKLLQRVVEDTDAHFVFSPLTIWLQVTAMSEGAYGETLKQIWNVTRRHRDKCLRSKLRTMIFELSVALKLRTHRRGNSIMAIDKELSVKKKFIQFVQKYYGITVYLLNFDQQRKAANMVNKAFEDGTKGIIDTVLYYDDFGPTKLILADASTFHNTWLTQFFYHNTRTRPFYSTFGKLMGAVSMMQQTGYYYFATFPNIGANVLDLPSSMPGVSMLIFLTTVKTWVGELYHGLQKIKLTTILKSMKRDDQKLVNVNIPKFDLITEVENLEELISDMGISNIFSENADLKGISKYMMHASMMTQISRLRVTEKGTQPAVLIEAVNETIIDFVANRPFVYMLVDKDNELILFAGAYSVPSKM